MKKNNNSKIIIGTMSGTSLDGLDMCAVEFHDNAYQIIASRTYVYDSNVVTKLSKAHTLSALELAQLHVDYGTFCAEIIREFITSLDVKPDYIASHGHTVFHTPHTGLTLQIGSGAHIAAITGISTISDFRTLDVAFGGQGAPLVPIGDEFLFSEYEYCLNIGGFANVSCKHNNTRIAWDICATNIVLNEFAKACNQEFDKDGNLGRQGQINTQLLHDLQSIAFFAKKPPKSLAREWVEQEILPLFRLHAISDVDKMRTFYEHIGMQIGAVLIDENTRTLCTGGGTFNSFIIERIQHYSKSKLIVPSVDIINFKEALIFAYLGYLRVMQMHNSLASVTGAQRNVCGGVIWQV